jgi:hypothetical protein
MYIIRKENVFWNAENDCWTEAREAATQYEKAFDVPAFLPCSNTPGHGMLDAGIEGDEVCYYTEDERCVANSEPVSGGKR